MELYISRHEQTAHDAIMDKLRLHQMAGEKAYLVVPEQFTFQSDIHLLEYLHASATMDIKVKSFESLSREVISRLGSEGRQSLTKLSRNLLVKKAVENCKDELSIFHRVSSRKGAIDLLADTISEFKMVNLENEILYGLAEKNNLTTVMAQKLCDLAKISEHYDRLLNGRYLDMEGKLALLANSLSQAEWLQDIHFYFYSFYSMNRLELKVLETIEKLGWSLNVALSLPPEACTSKTRSASVEEHEAYSAAWKFYEKLKEFADPLNWHIHPLDADDSIPMDIQYLAKEAFQWKQPISIKNHHNIILQQAPSTESEVVAVAQRICFLVAEENKRYKDFTIAVTRSEEYFPLVRRVFHEHNIPVFIDEKRNLSENLIVRSIFLLLSMIENGLQEDDVFAYLKTGVSGISKEEIQALERHVKRRKLKGKMIWNKQYYEIDDERLNNGSHHMDILLAETALAWTGAETLKEQIESLYDSCRSENNVLYFSTALYHFLTSPSFKDGIDIVQSEIKNWPNEALFSENNQIINLFIDLLDELVLALGNEWMSFSDFSSLLQHAVLESSVGIVPPAQDQVLVGTLNRTRTRRSAYQFILGMSDAWLPAQNRAKTIFANDEKEILQKMGVILPSSPMNHYDEEVLSLYQAFTRPTDKLILSWPLSDRCGQTMNRSSIIRRVLDCLSEVKVSSALMINRTLRAYSKPLAFSWTMESLRRLRDGRTNQSEEEIELDEIGNYYRYFVQHDDAQAGFLHAGLDYNNKRLPLSEQLSQQLYSLGTYNKTSITELETYRTCPFRHFIKYGLRPYEESYFDIERRESGILVHEVMARITADLSDPQLSSAMMEKKIVQERLKKHLHDAVQEIFTKERLADERNSALLKKINDNAIKVGSHVIRQIQSGKFRPIQQEMRFGRQFQTTLHLECQNGRVALEGAIDRIDAYHGYIRVIDYKTGNKGFDLTRALDGLDLQLLLYLVVALNLNHGFRPAGVFYLNLVDHFINEESDDVEKIQQELIKSLLLDGVIIKDKAIIEHMDESIITGKPEVLRLFGRKRKDISAHENVLSEEIMKALLSQAVDNAAQIAREILAGGIDVYPAEISNVRACHSCSYQPLCRIEESSPTRSIETVKWSDLHEYFKGGDGVD